MRRVVLIAIAVIALAVAAYHVSAGNKAPAKAAAATPPIPVQVTGVVSRNVPIYLTALGTVQASQTVTVRPMIDGPLTSVNFKEGQDVTAGTVLARIDPRPYQATLDQANGKLAQDKALLANAELDLVRYVKLAKTAYSSAQQADTQRAVVAQDKALVKQDQASVESAQTQLSYTTIKAPIDGRTGLRQVDVGNIVHTTDANGLVVIATLHPIAVIFTLPQQDLPQVQAALTAGSPEALASLQGATGTATPDQGTLTVLDNQVDPTTGTIKLKAMFPNPQSHLWPGAFVTVKLLARTQDNAIVVPPVAVQQGPDGDYVYVVAPGNTVSRRIVTVSHQDEQVAVISSGLKPGEQVVVNGAARLNDKSRIKILAGGVSVPALPVPAPAASAQDAGVPARQGGAGGAT